MPESVWCSSMDESYGRTGPGSQKPRHKNRLPRRLPPGLRCPPVRALGREPDRVGIAAPVIPVDTTDGYAPAFDALVAQILPPPEHAATSGGPDHERDDRHPALA